MVNEFQHLDFNDLWHSEGFISGVDSVWSYYEGIDKGVPPMSVSEYCKSVQENAQALLIKLSKMKLQSIQISKCDSFK